MNDLKFDLDDIVIVPTEESNIESRSECDVSSEFDNGYALPLMAAPMDTVVSTDNYNDFIRNGIIPCLPRRNIDTYDIIIKKNQCFQAFGLCEIENQINNDYNQMQSSWDYEYPLISKFFYNFPNVLIDTANGHMSKLIPIIKEIKRKYKS